MKKEIPMVRVALSEVAGQLLLEVVSPVRQSRRLLAALHEAVASVRGIVERLEVHLSGEDISAHLLLGSQHEALSPEHHGELMAAVFSAIDRGLR